MLNIGLLSPTSTLYPPFTMEFLACLKLGINANFKENWSFCTESIGQGVDSGIFKEKSQKLFIEKDVPLVIGILGEFISEDVHLFFEQNRVAFVQFDFGANFIKEKDFQFVNLFSLELWKKAYLTGKKIAQNHTNVLLISSFYESGYQIINAFEQGLMSNSELIPERLLVNVDSTFSSKDIRLLISNKKIDCVYFLGGDENILEIIKVISEIEEIPIYTSPLYSQKNFLSPSNKIPSDIKYLTDWNHEKDQKWITSFKEKFDRSPNIIGFEAYELGNIIGSTLNELNGQISSKKISEILSNKINAYRFKKNDALFFHPQMKEKKVDTSDISFTVDPVHSGWTNPYLMS